MDSVSSAEIPEGMRSDARETWPSHDLIESWLGDSMYDFQLRPGEDVVVDADDPEAVAAARKFRDVLGRFASGVTVVTAISGGAPVGLTCQSFSSVSLNPPLVVFIPAKTSRAWPMIQRSGRFCVNFLADGQAELSNQMASRGVDKFAGVGLDTRASRPARRSSRARSATSTARSTRCTRPATTTSSSAGSSTSTVQRRRPRQAAAVLPGQVRLDRLIGALTCGGALRQPRAPLSTADRLRSSDV